jgi:signal transduction histidine kinase
MSTDPATTPTLAALRASRAQQEAVARWLRPVGPLVMVVVIWAAFGAHPAPGLGGRHLAVTIVLAGFTLGALGVLATLWRRGVAHIGFVTVVLAASAALVWLQPDGVGIAGIFVGIALLAPLLRRHLSIPLTVVILVLLGIAATAGGRASITSVLLNAAMIGSFYGLLFFAIRLGEANQLAERLLIELEQSRAAETRAAGLAERQRLAREMHDVLAHSLSGLMLQLEGARMLAATDPTDPRLPQAVDRAHQLGKTGLDEARRAIGMLRDEELPGPERLAALAAQFQQDHDIPCRLSVSGDAYPLGSEARLALYRVAQEALTNVARHAHPERVELRLAYEPSVTRLTVEDFTTPNGSRRGSAGEGGGYGLTGMRERAELLGGRLTTGTTPGGFRVELDIPA